MKKPWYSFLYIKTTVGKTFWGILALLLTLGLFIFLWNVEDERMLAQSENWDGRSIEKGAEIFANNCAACHNPDGHGQEGRAPALNSKYFFTQRLKDLGYTGTQHSYIEGTVAAGRPSNTQGQWSAVMPTWGAQFGGPLRADQVDAVADFIMNWESTAILQTHEEDPWQPFINAPTTGFTDTLTTTVTTTATTGLTTTGTTTATTDLTTTGSITATTNLTTSVPPTGTAPVTPTVAGPTEGNVRPPDELFVSMACATCHNLDLPQTAEQRGVVGPNLGNLADIAAAEAPEMTPEEYTIESIADPAAHVAEGYAANTMPPNFNEKMSEEEIQGLAQWLLDPNRAE